MPVVGSTKVRSRLVWYSSSMLELIISATTVTTIRAIPMTCRKRIPPISNRTNPMNT